MHSINNAYDSPSRVICHELNPAVGRAPHIELKSKAVTGVMISIFNSLDHQSTCEGHGEVPHDCGFGVVVGELLCCGHLSGQISL